MVVSVVCSSCTCMRERLDRRTQAIATTTSMTTMSATENHHHHPCHCGCRCKQILQLVALGTVRFDKLGQGRERALALVEEDGAAVARLEIQCWVTLDFVAHWQIVGCHIHLRDNNMAALALVLCTQLLVDGLQRLNAPESASCYPFRTTSRSPCNARTTEHKTRQAHPCRRARLPSRTWIQQ
jgi:hypothetical protein